MITLQVQNLHKAFHHHEVLSGVTFTAKKGEVFALLGGSGSGKSTLLRCINLLTIPDQGSIAINQDTLYFSGENKTPLTSAIMTSLRKKVGMVFQQFNLWAHMTVLENLIEAPIHVLKQNKVATIAQAKLLLKKVGLAEKAAAYPGQLSGGQQQRAAIARALMMKPEIMLFDEPTSALDPEMVGEVLSVMQQLAQEGMTMIVATHELKFAERVAHHAIFLDAGKIIEQGDSKVLFKNPQTTRLRRFLEGMQR